MKRLLYYLPLHFVLLLILGIYVQFTYKIWTFGLEELIGLIAFVLFILILIKVKKAITTLTLLLFFALGVLIVFINNHQNYSNYYKNHISKNSLKILTVKKVLKPSYYQDKYVVKIIQIDSLKTRGQILLNVDKDSTLSTFKVDQLLLTQQELSEIIPPLNPHQFNYKAYLKKQGIEQQLFVNNNQIKSIGFAESSLVGFSANFRSYVQQSLKENGFKNDEFSVMNALLLGQRQDISKGLLDDYANAGAIHILAVSGLHVGILLLILSQLLKPFERIKKGVLIKTFLIVLFLWTFAFIAGLSASVVRAVTMFTFLAIGMSFKKKKITEFTLISSMFILLVFKPMFLFDVGFQLSYLAVFGIIYVQPKLYELWIPKTIVTNKIWQLLTVSIAAQIGVLPLSLYYFHQFPGLFLLSNLLIIPFLGAILLGGILIIILALFKILPSFLADFYQTVIGLMNSFVSWIANQEQFLFKDISFSFFKMILTYSVFVFGVYFFFHRKPKRLLYFLGSIILIQAFYIYENYKMERKQELIIFHKSRTSLLGIREGKRLNITNDLNSTSINNTSILANYKVGENIEEVNTIEPSNIYDFRNNKLLVIDSLGVYQVNRLKNAVVLLQYSPKINLNRVVTTLKPTLIIADGSNYKSYVQRWKLSSQKENIPFYYTGENGAYVFKN